MGCMNVLFYDPKGVTDGPLPRTLCAKSIAACLKLFTHTVPTYSFRAPPPGLLACPLSPALFCGRPS